MNAYLELQASGNNWIPSVHDMQFRSNQESPTFPVPRSCVAIFNGFEKQMSAFAAESEAVLREVRRHFVMPSDSSVATFLAEHRSVPQTLLEAADHLRECFGTDTVFRLGTTVDEAGLQTLHAAVIWPGRVAEARTALARFDDWWLAHVRPGTGHLTFTYELV